MKKRIKAAVGKVAAGLGFTLNRDRGNFHDSAYGVTYVEHNIPGCLPAKSVYPAKLTIENTGRMTWVSASPDVRSVAVYVRQNEKIVDVLLLPGEIVPGGRTTLRFPLKVPSEPGPITIMLELVEFQVTLFRDRGVLPLIIEMKVDPPLGDPDDDAWEIASRLNPWHFQPTRGISRGPGERRYPVVAGRSKGCHIWDLAGREYLDYVMGWGSVLLGYGEERIQRAIIEAVRSTGPMAPYVHPFELDVTEMLCEDIPSAEMVVFGKNGSDVCTVAARISRALTGRKIILHCGYHGWQDWWVEQMGSGRTGVPDRPVPLIHNFKFNDLSDFFRLFDIHKGDLAAVMLEPAGPLGSDEIGFEPDANREFLQTLAKATHDVGAFLVFDEIITGYRYPGGSVQKAVGVVPDMTCLGKALASGMPLSALAGRAEVLREGMPRTRYAPTFKGEIYSFAAAKAAIPIYRTEPVADYVWSYGLELKRRINELCRHHGIPGICTGTPFRMMLVFPDENPYRSSLKKTLYFQELLTRGLCTYNGIMIPSYAHTKDIMEQTLEIIGSALETVAEGERKDDLERRLEIPLLIDIV